MIQLKKPKAPEHVRTYPNSRVGSKANYSGKGLKGYLGGNLLHSVRVVCWGRFVGITSAARLYCKSLLAPIGAGHSYGTGEW